MGVFDKVKRRRTGGGDDDGGQDLEYEEVKAPEVTETVDNINRLLREHEEAPPRRGPCGCW